MHHVKEIQNVETFQSFDEGIYERLQKAFKKHFYEAAKMLSKLVTETLTNRILNLIDQPSCAT